jgi:hypothetical protein
MEAAQSPITIRQTLHARQVAKDSAYSLPRKCMNMHEPPLKLQRCGKNVPARTAKVASGSPNSQHKDSAVKNSTKPPDHPNYPQQNLRPTCTQHPESSAKSQHL